MRNIPAIALREINSYFVSPIAYIVIAAFLAGSGYFFSLILFYTREASMRFLFGNIAVILLLLAPLLTMRLLAEEQKSGTIELLLTNPVRDSEVVLGKFLAGLTFLGVMIGLTLYFPFLLFVFGSPDPGPIISGYLGLLLLGSTLLSIGLLASSLTANQIVAAVVSFVLALILWAVDGASGLLGSPLGDIVAYASLSAHFDDLARGVVDSSHLVFYITASALFLFLTVRSVETRRWR